MSQQHDFHAYYYSNIQKMTNDTFYVKVEEPLYTQSKFIAYDFKNVQELNLDENTDHRDYRSFDMQPRAKYFRYYSGSGHTEKYDRETFYHNLDSYPDLRDLFVRKRADSLSFDMYTNGSYELGVWDSVAYVVSKNHNILSVLIDESYSLQSGDSDTYVWTNGASNFAVYNDGDVYSVVFIKEKI